MVFFLFQVDGMAAAATADADTARSSATAVAGTARSTPVQTCFHILLVDAVEMQQEAFLQLIFVTAAR